MTIEEQINKICEVYSPIFVYVDSDTNEMYLQDNEVPENEYELIDDLIGELGQLKKLLPGNYIIYSYNDIQKQ